MGPRRLADQPEGWPCLRPDTFQRNSVPQETDRSGGRLSRSISIDTDRPGKPPYSHSIINGACKSLSCRAIVSASTIFAVRFTVNLI